MLFSIYQNISIFPQYYEQKQNNRSQFITDYLILFSSKTKLLSCVQVTHIKSISLKNFYNSFLPIQKMTDAPSPMDLIVNSRDDYTTSPDTWLLWAEEHIRLGCADCGLFKLVEQAFREGMRTHMLTNVRIYRIIADAIYDHMDKCCQHLGDEEMLLLSAVSNWYRRLARQEVPALHCVRWIRLFMDGFFCENHFLREPTH